MSRSRQRPANSNAKRHDCRCPTGRSSRSSKATAPGRTSGGPASACSTRRSRRPTAASGRSPGRKCSPGRSRSTRPATGCPTKRSTPSASCCVGIKGPLTTPVGGGIRSLNVALRQMLDLFVCLRPVRYFHGVPTPGHASRELVDMVIFRENTEDIYAGIEYAGGTPESQKVLDFLAKRVSEGVRQDPLRHQGESRRLAEAARSDRRAAPRLAGRGRHRLQADQLPRHRAARAQRDRLRDPEQAQERDARAQGQHHEVHRGRLPRLGLPGRQASSTAPRRSTAARGAAFPTASRAAASSSRTSSPTPSCSRFSRGRPTTTSSPRRTSTAITSATRWPRASAASASPRARTSTTSPATPSSKPRTAPRPSTPARTR